MMQNLTCYILDDEQGAIDNLRNQLQVVCPLVTVTGSSSSVAVAAEAIVKHNPDILFLDIRLQGEAGFDLLNILPDYDGSVIFVTAHDEYGLKAIKFSATDYLLKPLDAAELLAAVEKAARKRESVISKAQISMLLQSFSNQKQSLQKKIALADVDEIRYVDIDAIVYCKSVNSYTTFFLLDGLKITVSKGIGEYEELLMPYGFVRTHQSYLVNKNK
ncbi:MAG: response regulator transcription factor, partial [Pedobacter sp.]